MPLAVRFSETINFGTTASGPERGFSYHRGVLMEVVESSLQKKDNVQFHGEFAGICLGAFW